jgi:hypothetical protein
MTDTAGRWTVHASDRTLAASLGFADPDKREPRHELACQYLATNEGTARLADSILTPILDGISPWKTPLFRGERRVELEDIGPPKPEKAIIKGHEQYRTVIGFVDLVFPYTIKRSWSGEEGWESYDHRAGKYQVCWKADNGHCYDDGRLAVEVKATPVPASDVVRQLNLYREFFKAHCWLVVTTYPIAEADLRTFEAASIRHARLGKSFDAWCEQQRRERSSGGAASIEL